MKKVAILLYDQFCNFEISVALEMFAMAHKPITILAKDKNPVRSEEGIIVLPDQTIKDCNLEEYDTLLLPGAMDIRSAMEDETIIHFIQTFHKSKKLIGAISIAPLLLLKAGILIGKPFMAGVNQEDLYEEGFTPNDLTHMIGWNDNLSTPVKEGYIKTDNIITSISYNFIKWSMAIGKEIGIEVYPKSFGLE